MSGRSWRSGAAILVAIGVLALARKADAETIDLQCTIGTGGPPAILHLDLDARTAQMIEGKYPSLDAEKHELGETEPEVEWQIIRAMGLSIYRYNRAAEIIKDTEYGEYGPPDEYTWPCAKIIAKP